MVFVRRRYKERLGASLAYWSSIAISNITVLSSFLNISVSVTTHNTAGRLFQGEEGVENGNHALQT